MLTAEGRITVDSEGGFAADPAPVPELGGGGDAAVTEGWEGASRGVAGALGEGEADSTTHIRWDRVATSLATVWARVE